MTKKKRRTTRRRWTDDQKLAMVQTAKRDGKKSAAQRYDVSPTLLRKWEREFDASRRRPKSRTRGTGGQEIRQLEARNRELQKQNEFLKDKLLEALLKNGGAR